MKPQLAIGVGCRAGAASAAIVGLVARARTGLDAEAPAMLFTVADKRGEPGLAAAAAALGLDLVFLSHAAMAAVAPRVLTASKASMARFALPSIAEAAALAGAGPGARLLVPRIAGGRRHLRDRRPRVELAPMTVHFIGAGPGAPDLITLRGRDLLARCPVCLYAGSLVPRALLEHCPPGARIVDTAPLDLEAIVMECSRAQAAGQDVARLHSGDLSIWSAMGEQLRRLRGLGIPVTVTPGVPAFAAAAAALEVELTLPELAQSLVLTRTPGRASAVPPRETLEAFASTGATLAIHLSIHALAAVVEALTPHYGEDCPAAVVARASWPDERMVRGTLGTLVGLLATDPVERTALILVGPVLAAEDPAPSALYSADYRRRFRG